MSAPVCPEHNLLSVAKTSVPNKNTGGFYPPFYGCTWTGFDSATGKKIYCKHRFEEKPTVTEMASSIQGTAVASGQSKDVQIKFMNALNCASLLLSQDEGDSQEKLNRLKSFAESIFRMEAPTGPVSGDVPF